MKNKINLLFVIAFSFIWSFSHNPENELVGAPQQNTCNLCHSNSAFLYDENASISISGLPEIINPGENYNSLRSDKSFTSISLASPKTIIELSFPNNSF